MTTAQMYAASQASGGNSFDFGYKPIKIDLGNSTGGGSSVGTVTTTEGGASASGGGWWNRNGATITGIAQTAMQLGLTATQIAVALKSGDATAVNTKGQKVDISGLKQEIELQARMNNERFEDRFNRMLDYLQKTENTAPTKKANNTLLYVALGLLGVTVLGVGGYFVFSNKKSNEKK